MHPETGERLPSERDQAERPGVPRPSQRDARARLQRSGLLKTRRRCRHLVAPDLGAVVQSALSKLFARHTEALFNFVAFRRDMERLAAERAAFFGTQTDHALIETIFGRMSAAPATHDPDREARYGAGFNLAIIEASRNTIIMRAMFDMLQQGISYHREIMCRQLTTRAMLLAQHGAIRDPILARDRRASCAGTAALEGQPRAVHSGNMSRPVAFILITVVLDAMGIGLIVPVMPELIQQVQGIGISDAAVWGGILSAIFAVMQFLFSPTLGNLSDRFGRRPVLLVSTAAMAFDYILMAVAGSIWLLLIGRVIGGITAATSSTAGAFMADISTPAQKAQNFGLIGAGFGVGFVFGPVIGGLLGEFGPRAPFYAAAGLAAANFVFGYFVLPETVTPQNRRPFRWRRANPLGGLKHIGSLPGLTPLLAVYFFYQIANMVYPAIWAYYTQAAFGWGPGMIGVSLAVYGIGAAFTQAVLIRFVIARLGEVKTVYFGLVLNSVILAMIAFVTSGWLLLALTPVASFGMVVGPALQSVMSQRAGNDQQGELQGVMASINAIGMIVTPIVMTQVFAMFTGADAWAGDARRALSAGDSPDAGQLHSLSVESSS